MVSQSVAYAVAMHFDSNVGMSYWDDLGRRSRTVERPEWWAMRKTLVLDYVLPSIPMKPVQPQVWAFLDPRDAERSADLRRELYYKGVEATYEGPRAMREHYKGCDWLCVLHTDTDDMMHKHVMADLQTLTPAPGLTAWWNRGYMYGIHDGRMKIMETYPPVGPPPFYAQYYPKSALQSARAWIQHRDTYRMAQRHQDIRRKCKVKHEFSQIGYCGTIHGENTSRAWDNANTNKRLGKEITKLANRMKILDDFGVAEGLRKC
jgi:hypothetical protein